MSQVKPLGWVETTSLREDGPPEPLGEWSATSVTGVYSVYIDADEEMASTPWVAWGEFTSVGHFESPDAAKAAALADYEARILSALTPPAPSKVVELLAALVSDLQASARNETIVRQSHVIAAQEILAALGEAP